MTKNDLIMEIDDLLRVMTPTLRACGVDVTKYQQDYEKRTVPQVKEGRDWLKERLLVIDGYCKIRKLLSEEIWAQYQHMDTEDFREVKLLNEAIAKIKKSFVGRPALFRKVKDGSKCKRSSPIEG